MVIVRFASKPVYNHTACSFLPTKHLAKYKSCIPHLKMRCEGDVIGSDTVMAGFLFNDEILEDQETVQSRAKTSESGTPGRRSGREK